MALSTQPYKGARDFYPEDMRIQKFLFKAWRKVAERYGYEEYDAPIVEPIEIYTAKTGEEIVNEQTYTFTDRGGRQVAIRPEMTPSVSRMVAGKRQELSYPLRWFNIGNRWRYERPQRGRGREFWQLDVDLFGIDGVEADFEIIQVADAIMRQFKAKPSSYTIQINNRKLMNFVLCDYLGLDNTQALMMSKLIDRMHKIDGAQFSAHCYAIFSPSQRESGAPDKLSQFLDTKNILEMPDVIKKNPNAVDVMLLLELLNQNQINNVSFEPSIMRGFDYYTGMVFEVVDNDPENNRSMFGGGRYDGLVGLFGAEPVPTVGFAVGDITLQNFLLSHKLMPETKSETDAYIVLIGDVSLLAQPVIARLRNEGVNIAVDISGRKPDKQINSAHKKNVRYVIFIGETELNEERYSLKDIKTGAEERHGLDRLISILKDHRKR
jgi:histidyl-tRNA synthetase